MPTQRTTNGKDNKDDVKSGSRIACEFCRGTGAVHVVKQKEEVICPACEGVGNVDVRELVDYA